MSIEQACRVIHQQVYASAFEIAHNNYFVPPNHHEVHIQYICGTLFGRDWYNFTLDEQWAKRNIIWTEYRRLLTNYMPVLRQFMQDTSEILWVDEANLGTLFSRPIDARTFTTTTFTMPTSTTTTLDMPTGAATSSAMPTSTTTASIAQTSITKDPGTFDDSAAKEVVGDEKTVDDEENDEILRTEVAMERDGAARKNLVKYYGACQQGRKDLMIKRAKEPEGNLELFVISDIPLNDDKKTKNCPACGKAINHNVIKRHYQITHAKDPRWVIYCPAPHCEFKCWRGDATILTHTAYHHEDLHRKIFGQGDVQKRAKARKRGFASIKARKEWYKKAAKLNNSTAKSEGDEQGVEQNEQSMEEEDDPHHLGVEELDDEEMYEEEEDEDEEMHNTHLPDQQMPKEPDYIPRQPEDMHNQPEYVPGHQNPGQYMPGQYIPNQQMPGQHMSYQNVPRQQIPPQYMSNQHRSNQFMTGQYMSDQYMLGQQIPGQHTSNQHTSNQHMSNQNMSNQHMSNQYKPSQYKPSQYKPSQ